MMDLGHGRWSCVGGNLDAGIRVVATRPAKLQCEDLNYMLSRGVRRRKATGGTDHFKAREQQMRNGI